MNDALPMILSVLALAGFVGLCLYALFGDFDD